MHPARRCLEDQFTGVVCRPPFDSEEPTLFSDFKMRISFNETTNPRFAWYFMRSVAFQAQIEREQRGTSLPNIFPGQVERLLIVKATRKRQDTISAEVTAELQKLGSARRCIEAKRSEIDSLIEAAMREELDSTRC